jgi:ABC-type branched-subunit amino acid transport system permease subunit
MEYLIHIAILVCIYGILALSLDLVVGEAEKVGSDSVF